MHMKTEAITPGGEESLSQGVGSAESSSRSSSVVDQTGASLREELQIFSSEWTGKKRSTGVGFIESGGDDPRLQDLL